MQHLKFESCAQNAAVHTAAVRLRTYIIQLIKADQFCRNCKEVIYSKLRKRKSARRKFNNSLRIKGEMVFLTK